MKRKPRVIIIAGPHGAGKTTFAREFLPADAACPQFVNVDLIAAGLAPLAPTTAIMQARQVMHQELQRHFEARNSFAFETTLAGRGYLRSIEQWRAAGYRVKLIFLQLDSAKLAIARLAHRVLPEGHAVSPSRIRRDFMAGLTNFANFYAPCVDAWALYDNAGVTPMLLRWRDFSASGPVGTVRDRDLRRSFTAIRRSARHVQEMAELTGTPIVVSRNGVLEAISSGFDDEQTTIHEPRAKYGGH
jgi:predicted ABC-type ATPase